MQPNYTLNSTNLPVPINLEKLQCFRIARINPHAHVHTFSDNVIQEFNWSSFEWYSFNYLHISVSQRARLVLAAKGIEYERVNINLKDKPEWFLELNPRGTVPVIEHPDGRVIYESAICCGRYHYDVEIKYIPPWSAWGCISRVIMSYRKSSIKPPSPGGEGAYLI